MRFRLLALLATLPALVVGCVDQADNATPPDPTPSGDGGGGGNESMPAVLANGTFSLGPAASSVIPGVNGTVTLVVNVTEAFERVSVNTTIVTGTSVNLRFFGLGACADTIDGPAQPDETYSRDCGPVPLGQHNLTYAHDSGTVSFRVEVLGHR